MTAAISLVVLNRKEPEKKRNVHEEEAREGKVEGDDHTENTSTSLLEARVWLSI